MTMAALLLTGGCLLVNVVLLCSGLSQGLCLGLLKLKPLPLYPVPLIPESTRLVPKACYSQVLLIFTSHCVLLSLPTSVPLVLICYEYLWGRLSISI